MQTNCFIDNSRKYICSIEIVIVKIKSKNIAVFCLNIHGDIRASVPYVSSVIRLLNNQDEIVSST